MDYQRQSEFENARTSPVRTPVQYGFQSPVETPRENKKQLLNVFLTGGLPTQQFSPLESRSLVRGETSVKRTSNSGRNEDYVPPTQLKTKDKWSADRNTPKGRAPPRYSLLEESETNSGSASKDLSFRTVASPQLRNQFERTEPSLSPRSEGTSCWVTVFGFGPSLQAAVLREFRNYGEINFVAGTNGNWKENSYGRCDYDDKGSVSKTRYISNFGNNIGTQYHDFHSQTSSLYMDAPRPAAGFLETLRNIFNYWIIFPTF
ncbi:Nucleoporin NUP53 [Galdieria sulphuraria]|nr:Nucleoporin NUP53 [Galdieria sulphuraria]